MTESIFEQYIDVSIVDSWVRATKLASSSGHGESRLYVGGDSTGKYTKFFSFDNLTCIILKDEILSYLANKHSQFFQSYSKFAKGIGMKQIWQENIQKIGSNPNEKIKFSISTQKDKSNRFYIKSEDEIFHSLRDILIPLESIIRIENRNDGSYLWEIIDLEKKLKKSHTTKIVVSDEKECDKLIQSKWAQLEKDRSLLHDEESAYALITFYKPTVDGLYLGIDKNNRRMLLKQINSTDENEMKTEFIYRLIAKHSLFKLSSVIKFIKYEISNRIFFGVKLLDEDQIELFEDLVCIVSENPTMEENFVKAQNQLSKFHREFNRNPSNFTFEKFQSEPHLFKEYHLAYRESRESGITTHDYLFEFIVKYHNDEDKIIVDFGCGEALLAQNLASVYPGPINKNKSHTVINLDHYDFSKFDDVINPVPDDIKIHEVDFTDEKNLDQVFSKYKLSNQFIDIAIFSLSLWGTSRNRNQNRSSITIGFVNAYNRLKPDGELHIIETCSRFNILRSDSLKEVLDNKDSKLSTFLQKLEDMGLKVQPNTILELNENENAIYAVSNRTFIHIIGKKDRYSPRIPNNLSDVSIAFKGGQEDE